MRLFTLFFMVVALSPRVFGLYDTDVLDTSAAMIDCSELSRDCRSSSLSNTFRQSFELAQQTCLAEQKSLNCSSLATQNPELQKKIRNCSPQALCEDSQKEVGMMLKGCFWNAPGTYGEDFWSTVKENAQKAGTCLKDSKCSSHVLDSAVSYTTPMVLFWMFHRIPPPPDLQKAKDSVTQIYESGKNWVKEKGIELQCFDRKSQAELVCYGVLNVFAPAAVMKVGSKVPKLISLLRLTPAQKAEKLVVEGVDLTKRSPASTARKTPSSLRTASRAVFIETNLNLELTSTDQNLKWMKLAENVKPDGKTKFFEVENSVMKLLNDTTQDKNFVTALTNKEKQILKSKMNQFAIRHPDIEILPYSDFKAMRFAIRPKPPATSVPASLEKELGQLFQESNHEFSQYLKENHLVRDADQPAEWFRAGFGETADQATLASRYSRNISGENQLRSFSDSGMHENLQTSLKATEMFRSELQNDLQKTNLMEVIPGTEKMTFKKEVFEAVRKTTSPSDLQETLEKSYGVRVSESQARKIRDYSELIDEFSPGIQVAKREVASLSDSSHGGLSIDFSGLGAQNLKATASALVRSEKVEDAVVQTRLSEKSVTESLKQKKKAVQSSVQSILERHGIQSEVITSGDDLVVKPSKPIPPKAREEIAQDLSKNIDPSAIRAAHVPDGVSDPADRMIIGTHGETIEKMTRKNLQGQIPKEKLDQVLLMVDMDAKSSGQGAAQLILGTSRNQLNDLEKQKIKKAFEKAVQDMNQKLQKDNLPANYKAAG